jgi:histidyl-tRNA synthetase
VASAKQGGGDKNALMKKRIQLCAQLWDAGLRAEMSYKANPKVLEQFQYWYIR